VRSLSEDDPRGRKQDYRERNLVRATVIAHGGPEDAVEVVIDGQDVKRDVAFGRHEEGSSDGFVARVPYDLITTDQTE
jgi:hypothetical protein